MQKNITCERYHRLQDWLGVEVILVVCSRISRLSIVHQIEVCTPMRAAHRGNSLTLYISIMSTTSACISIIVFKGEPLDYQQYRHTSLHVSLPDEQDPFVAHTVGLPGEYEFQIREPYDSTKSQGIVRTVRVGDSLAAIKRAHMVEILRAVPVRNWDAEFNCQIWVEAALRRLRDLRVLSGEAYADGVDGMVDAIAEAEEEAYSNEERKATSMIFASSFQ